MKNPTRDIVEAEARQTKRDEMTHVACLQQFEILGHFIQRSELGTVVGICLRP